MNQVADQSLTCRERVLAAFRFEETKPIPYVLPIEEDVAERLDRYYGGPAWRERIQQHIGGIGIPSLGVPEDPHTPYTTDHFGTVWRSDKRPNHLEKPALPEPDLADYTWPDIDDMWDEAMIQQQLQEAQAKGQFIVGSLGFGLFERTWTIRGFENALMDVALRPDFYEALLDGILAFQLKTVRRLLAYPIDGVMFSDDWGDQRGVIIGPARWRKFVKPQYFKKLLG